jgi:hypothetical protein
MQVIDLSALLKVASSSHRMIGPITEVPEHRQVTVKLVVLVAVPPEL